MRDFGALKDGKPGQFVVVDLEIARQRFRETDPTPESESVVMASEIVGPVELEYAKGEGSILADCPEEQF